MCSKMVMYFCLFEENGKRKKIEKTDTTILDSSIISSKMVCGVRTSFLLLLLKFQFKDENI